MKSRVGFIVAAVLYVGNFAALAAPVKTVEAGYAATLDDFDIDLVVESAAKAMADAARNYYLPDKPENSKPIARYRKDSRMMIFGNTTFKRELARICVDLAKAAIDAGSPDAVMLPGLPLERRPAAADYDEGVSSITVTEGEVKIMDTNTMPCINSAVKALHDSVHGQFLPASPANTAAKDAYSRQFGSIMTANRLFNHELAEVCSKLVGIAKKEAERDRAKKKQGR